MVVIWAQTHSLEIKSTFFSHPSSTFYDFFYCPLLYLFAIHYSYHHFHNICILILCTALLKWFTFQLWFSLSYRFLLLFYLDNTFQYFFLGRFSTAVGEGNGTPLQYSCLENPWTEEPGRLQSMGSLRVAHDWATSLSLFTFMHWRRKWRPTLVFLPGESQGWESLVAAVSGVAQSRPRLRRLGSSSSSTAVFF